MESLILQNPNLSTYAQSPSPSPIPTDLLRPLASFGHDFWRIFLLLLLVALTWSILIWYDLRRAYRERETKWYPLVETMVHKASSDGLQLGELQELASVLSKAPTGVTGLARTTIALTVATIISVVLVLLVLTGGAAAQDFVKTIVTALVTAFATIIGFYFGARTAEGGAESGAAAAAKGTPSTPASFQ